MTGPLIPYIDAPSLPLRFLVAPLHFIGFAVTDADPPSIKPFGTLVALGVYLGSIVAVRHARQRGQDLEKMNSFIFWVVGLGFVGGHVFDAIFYTPEKLSQDPWYLIKLWAGLSSFGGFLGAIIGAVAFKLTKKEAVLPLVDTVCSAFPLAWVFGRSGCSSVHDHPGAVSTAWFAVKAAGPDVRSPAAGWSIGPGMLGLEPGQGRLDLGLIEMVLTIPLALAFWWLWRSKPRSYGFFAGYMCIAYAPVRFFLDFLRIPPGKGGEGDPRYGGLTPAQWACFALIGLGIYIVWMGKKKYGPIPATYEAMQEEGRLRELAKQKAEKDRNDDEDGDEERPRRIVVKSSSAATSTDGTAPKKKKKKKKRSIVATDEASSASKEDADDEKAEPEKSEAEKSEPEKSEAEKKSDGDDA